MGWDRGENGVRYTSPMTGRQRLHALVDQLPDPEVSAAQRYLEFLRERPQDSLGAFLAQAPWDDEPLTEEDRIALEEGLEEAARGEVVDHEAVRRLALEVE